MQKNFFPLLLFYCCGSTSKLYLEIWLKNHHTFRSQTRQHISSLLHLLYYSTQEVCESRRTPSFCPLFHQQHPSTLWREFWFKRQISMIFTSTSSYLQLYCEVFYHNHLILKKVHLCAYACQDWTTYTAHFVSRWGKLEIIDYAAGEQKHHIVDSFTAVIHNPPLQSSAMNEFGREMSQITPELSLTCCECQAALAAQGWQQSPHLLLSTPRSVQHHLFQGLGTALWNMMLSSTVRAAPYWEASKVASPK